MQGNTRRREKVLTAALVRSVQEAGKYHDGGGLGLFLRVDPNGARFWVQRVTIRGARRSSRLPRRARRPRRTRGWCEMGETRSRRSSRHVTF